MNSPTFAEVREAVARWIEDSRGSLADRGIKVDILQDNEAGLNVDLSFFGEYVANIAVHQPDFAPYRYVCYQAIAMEDGDMCFWYDEEGTTVEEIIKNLNNAIDVVSKHSDRVLHRDANSERRS